MLLILLVLLVVAATPWLWLNAVLRKAGRLNLTQDVTIRAAKAFQVLVGTVVGLLFLLLGPLWVAGSGPRFEPLPHLLVSATAVLQILFALCLLADWIGSVVFAILVQRRLHHESQSQPSLS